MHIDGGAWRKHLPLMLIAVVCMAAGGVVLYATQNGPWGYSDSVSYIVSARNLARGSGIGLYYPDGSFHWETHFPPLYSISLAVFAALGLDLVESARWLGLGLYILSILGAALILLRFCSARYLAVGAILLVAAFPTMINLFSSAMSEPLFVFLSVWGLFVLLLYFEDGRPLWFYLAAIVIGLLPLTRYVGLGLPSVMALALLLLQPGSLRTRLGKALQFGLLSNALLLAWLLWVRLRVDRTMGGRVIVISPASILAAAKYVDVSLIKFLWGWLPNVDQLPALPGNWKYAILFVLAALMIWLLLRARRAGLGSAGALRASVLLGLYALGYLLTLLAACIASIPRPDIDERMLLPVFLALTLGLLSAASIWGSLLTGWRQPALRLAGVVVLGLFLYNYFVQDVRMVASLRDSESMTSDVWRDAPIIKAARALPPHAMLISSASSELLIWADRPSYDFVETMGPAILDMTGPYGSDPASPVQAVFRKPGSFLIILNGVRSQMSQRYGTKGAARLDGLLSGLNVYANFDDGYFYTYPQGSESGQP